MSFDILEQYLARLQRPTRAARVGPAANLILNVV